MFLKAEDLDVYQRLCRLHIEICTISHGWPVEEKYELGTQVRKSSNSSPAQLAERQNDRHLRNKIEGVNRARTEASETVHHLYIALLKGYLPRPRYEEIRGRYEECIKMLNGLERGLERHLPARERQWPEDRRTTSGLRPEA
jgi:four helix bundle protein